MYLLTFIISTMSIILLFRLFYIQIVKGPFLAEAAFMQKTGPLVDKLRGGIYDTKGKSLTGSFIASFAVIAPNWLSAQEKQLLVENDILDSVDSSEIETIQLTPENSQIVYDLKGRTPGIAIYNKEMRYGPDALATHVVGFQGQTGIEKTFNSFLESDIKRYYVIRDGLGQPIGGIALQKPMTEAWGIKLTIDRKIQKIVEDIMDESIYKGAVVILDTNSGEVLCHGQQAQL